MKHFDMYEKVENILQILFWHSQIYFLRVHVYKSKFSG